jgi:hypothetical protein
MAVARWRPSDPGWATCNRISSSECRAVDGSHRTERVAAGLITARHDTFGGWSTDRYLEASNHGCAGQLMLGLQYAGGRYLKQDFELAYAWVALAAEPPNPPPYAAQIRAALASHLVPSELAKCQELVRSWKVGHDLE